jgi:hypothetical protein
MESSMLSEEERQALQEIELGATAADPGFAALLSPKSSRIVRRTRMVYDAVAVLSTLLAMVCLPLGAIGGGFTALLFAMVVITVRRRRFPTAPTPSGTSRPGSTSTRR